MVPLVLLDKLEPSLYRLGHPLVDFDSIRLNFLAASAAPWPVNQLHELIGLKQRVVFSALLLLF